MVLDKTFFMRDPDIVAKDILGKILNCKVNGVVLKGKVVETEAYFQHNDKACHTFKRESARKFLNENKAGAIYVYLIYGNHWLFNVLVKGGNKDGFVLFRALEPLDNTDKNKMTNGPGKLTKVFGIDKRVHGKNSFSNEIFFSNGIKDEFEVISKTRIGISEDKDKLLRYYIKDNPFVSRK